MAQLLYSVTSRVTCIYNILSIENERELYRKHIAEISKDYQPIQGEELTYEQQEWFESRKIRPFPDTYKSYPKTRKEFEFKEFSFAEILASIEPLEETD